MISLNETPTELDDKIGGIPYLPTNEKWPVDKNGNQLSLLLQVNLRNVQLEDFPNAGILEIFTESPLNWPCEYVVKIFEDSLE